jgi:hypothetical protein
MPSATPPSPDTREPVERFHVCWGVWPEHTFINHEKRQIGFELDLSGRHEDGEEHPEPGCEKCRKIYQVQVRIAEDVLPPADKDTTCQFEPYDQGICYSPRHGNLPEVVLRIRIVHRKAFERSADAPLLRYLEILQRRLEERGIGQR